jgi:riboflavin synthase
MFTGIVEGVGEVRNMVRAGSGATCTVWVPPSISDCRPGDSLCIDGVCLTVTSAKRNLLTLDVSVETLARSTLGSVKQGSMVNLERALRLSDRLGGHLVSGHVDGTGSIEKSAKVQGSWIISIAIDQGLSRYLIEKGSVAVDGISLTVNKCSGGFFEITVVPYTALVTTISKKRHGDRVNIEVDMISKYVEKFLSDDNTGLPRESASRIDRELLLRYGFGGSNGDL